MRREHLTWFAAGAACSSIVAVGAALATRKAPEEQGWFLKVGEGVQSLSDGHGTAYWKGAEIARDCGAKSFEMIPGIGSDATDSTRIPLIRENNPTLDCIVARAGKDGLWVGIDLEDTN